MPIIKSAAKRMRQTAKRQARNVVLKREIKNAIKAFLEKPSAKTMNEAQSKLDTAVKKKLLKKNTVARRKAQLAKVAKKEGVKLSKAAKKTAPKPRLSAKATKKPATKKAKAPAKKKTPAKKPAKS